MSDDLLGRMFGAQPAVGRAAAEHSLLRNPPPSDLPRPMTYAEIVARRKAEFALRWLVDTGWEMPTDETRREA